ncbi:hypothetical protein L249_7694 [Ophiocordyceps polyrhachis-furcata BCC 54312]|uniref:DNA repair protein RAD16 n=1 Tax=Ophiocordyceps polyrhachis-furcata BCC 54312 TaxID=1330021 RepID=A0A367LAP1_9HYPO|nr:hypothetical protein L249_7694 [Ophiocordyceps polyrhachis-furcata BCC 54312]
MPRRPRQPVQSLKSPSEASPVLDNGTRRLTRSSSLRTAARPSTPSGSQDSPLATVKRPRGRPSRASLLPIATASSSSPSGHHTRHTAAQDTVVVSEPVSSVSSASDISSNGAYSTPATSKLPTPSVVLGPKKSNTSLQVQLPSTPGSSMKSERVLRNSLRSSYMRDSVESDDDHLQPTTFAGRNSTRNLKRPRSPSSSLTSLPPSKKNKSTTTDVATEAVTGDSDGSGSSSDSNPMFTSDSDSDSDLEPLSTRRRAPRASRVEVISDSEIDDSDSEIDDSGSDIDDSDSEIGDSDSETDDSDSSSDPSTGFASAVANDPEAERERADNVRRLAARRRGYRRSHNDARVKRERNRLEYHHPEITTMWTELEKTAVVKPPMATQPQTISRRLKPFQLEGLAWMQEMEKTEWKGGLLGDEMGLGKTIQAVSLIMSDFPAQQPSLVLVPPVALMQWQSEIKDYTDGTLKTIVFHGTNQKTKGMTVKELKKYDVIMMSYNSLESMFRKQERGFTRKNGIHKEKSVIHSIDFHRIILDEAHCIKTRTTMTAKACFALKTRFRWCLTGTPLQNRIGEFFSLIRFLNMKPFASYLCKQCSCTSLEWNMNGDGRCGGCRHTGMQHVSVFNQELLNPIQKFGNVGPGREAFRKMRLMTERIMLRRLKKDNTKSMELPVKEIYVDRQFFGEEEYDFARSIMNNGQRNFDTYVAQGVLLNNYANIFGLIMQMRQVADHPDLILKKHAEGGQNVLVCCICDEPAEEAVRSRCKHEFCRACVGAYIGSTAEPDCPRCHIPLSVDLEQPDVEQDEGTVKKNSIINRIKMENWTSSSKIELLVHELHKLRSDNASHKSIIFSQFTTMLQLIEWRLRRAGITTVMLDGSMTPAQRQASIDVFMNKVDVECFLVSLKAGGVALNLTEASRVFIVDPWWNPAAEWQSADRCHRIGQTRPCTITRLCIEDSVESRMVLIQEKKTSMIHSTVNGDEKAMETLSPQDMQFLFRGS